MTLPPCLPLALSASMTCRMKLETLGDDLSPAESDAILGLDEAVIQVQRKLGGSSCAAATF